MAVPLAASLLDVLRAVGGFFKGLWDFITGFSPLEVAYYVVVTGAIIILYEVLRFIVVGKLKRRFERSIQEFLRDSTLSAETYKFTHRLIIKQELLADPWLIGHMAEYARGEGKGLDEVRLEAEGYIDEIVPHFSLLSYYKVGYNIAKFLTNIVYRVVVDEENRHRIERVPEGSVVVYVFNHRSNMDYIVIGYVLAGQVSLSYAVGEWARVWPLEHLFKSFGSYFVRRGYKNELYHRVLERYVQLICRHGVTQGVFPEGKLSRDGFLNPPKLGLLNWLAGVESDPNFSGRLTFVPVAINYDWVIEDEVLVAEALHPRRRRRAGFFVKLARLVWLPVYALGLGVVNVVKYATGRLKHHGTATVSFGDPIVLDQFMQERGVAFRELSADERRPQIEALGQRLMAEIGRVVPATPLVIVADALLRLARAEVARDELIAAVAAVRSEYGAAGIRVLLDKEFRAVMAARDLVESDRGQRGEELLAVEGELTSGEEAELLLRHGAKILRRRRLLTRKGDTYRLDPVAWPILKYYANSVAHLTGNRHAIGDGDASTLGEKSPEIYATGRRDEAGGPEPA